MRIAFPTDEHFPYQDEKARQVALKIVADYDPELMISGSDGLDFYSISSFNKNPNRVKLGLQNEIDAWVKGQKEWADASPHAKRFFLIGNHEDRLRRYIWQHPELAGVEALELQNLLKLDELGIFFEKNSEDPNKELVVYGNMAIKHGRFIRRGSAMSARAELDDERYAISVLSGHTHRGGVHYSRTRLGLVQAVECFCLCSLEPEYTRHPDWQQGIVLADVTRDSVSIEQVPFFDFRYRKVAHWRGKEYSV